VLSSAAQHSPSPAGPLCYRLDQPARITRDVIDRRLMSRVVSLRFYLRTQGGLCRAAARRAGGGNGWPSDYPHYRLRPLGLAQL
jgi:hypothetical protein